MGVTARVAAAQESVPPIEPPSGNLLDRADGVNRAGVALGYLRLDDSDVVDFTALRLDLFGQWLAPTAIGPVGGYAILPVSYARIDPEMGPTNAEWVIGDAELGAVYRWPAAPGLDVALHLGATLPTAPEGTFSSTEISGFANEFAVYARPNDLVQAVPESSYLRAGVSPMHASPGGFFWRGDLAVDVPLHSGNDGDLLTIGRLNGAVGVRVGNAAYLLEVVNLIALEKPEREEDDRVLTFVGLTADFGVGDLLRISPSLLLPLDDEINDAVDMVLILGVQALLP